MSSTSKRGRLANASRGRRPARDGAAAGDDREMAEELPRPLTQKGRRTRQTLLDTARTVFERDGFLHARIADICAAANMSHGSFYTYFSSKEEIFAEITDSVELELLSMDAPSPIGGERARIREANRRYFERYRDHAAILGVIQQVATFDPGVRETRVGRQDAFAALIERRIRKLQADGRADDDLDARFTATALGGMVAWMAEQAVLHERFADEDVAVEQLTRLWANAIGLTEDSDG